MTRGKRRSIDAGMVGLAVLAVGVAVLAGAALTKDVAPVIDAGSTPGYTPAPAPEPVSVAAFLGDSYTAGSGATAEATRWSSLVAAQQGWTERNFGFGGTGYAAAGTLTGGEPYTARVDDVIAATPSIVVVSGGRNDVFEDADTAEAVTETFQQLRAGLPQAQIVAVSPLWDDDARAPRDLADLGEQVRAAVEAVGGRYLDVGQPLQGHADFVIADSVHPNDTGHAAIAAAVTQALTQ